jgi:Mg2+ and Co2+ transporter CorA
MWTFNLLTRHYAESSRNIAELAQKDSYSMKTMAIVTMIFLPSTFIATLFAMPLLKWDQPQVIQRKFSLYWAFSIPITLLVLLIWHGTAAEKTIFRIAWESAFTKRSSKPLAAKNYF